MTDKKELHLTYEQLQERKTDLIESFNKVALNMINHLGDKFPESIFGKNNMLIKNFFKFKPKETIILFLENVYESDVYRKEIVSKNDRFFMEHTYDGAINSGYEMRIFEFKDLWMRMNFQTKTIVKDSMAMLVDHTSLYLDMISQINKIRK